VRLVSPVRNALGRLFPADSWRSHFSRILSAPQKSWKRPFLFGWVLLAFLPPARPQAPHAPSTPSAYVFGRADFSANNAGTVLAAGDLNEDGRPDFVSVDYSTNSVAILLGQTGGGFSDTGVAYPVGSEPVAAAVGDFNADGKLDLVVVNQVCPVNTSICSPGSVSILLGNGDGTFQPHVDYATGPDPLSVVVGDFNHDGILDLAVADHVSVIDGASPGMVSLLVGNGDGTFRAHSDFAAGLGVGSLGVGDFNRDGNLDLIVVNHPDENNISLSMFLGNGDASFRQAANLVAGGPPAAITTGDFNKDGKLDVAVTTDQSTVSVFLGNGDATFQPHVDYAVDLGPVQIVTADMNGDGTLDLVVSVQTAQHFSGAVIVLLGEGDGTFQQPVENVTGLSGQLLGGDFNGDGKLDIGIGTATGGGGGVEVLLGNGDGTLAHALDYTTDQRPNAVTTGDFNADGKLDLATANYSCAGSCSGTVSILLGNGDGTFGPHTEFPVGTLPSALTTGDFNGDGKLDLAVVNSADNTVSVMLGTGQGTFSPHVDYATGRSPQRIAVADFNRDGTLDLAVTNFGDNTVSILLGNGDGTFRTHVDYATGPGPLGLVTADLNNDGNLDLAVADNLTPITIQDLGLVSVLLGNGDGTFQPHIDSPTTAQSPAEIVAADFNGDGKLDLAITAELVELGFLNVLQGDGTGKFQLLQQQFLGLFAGPILSSDFNGDGTLDLAAASPGSNAVIICKGNGNGTFQIQSAYGPGSGPLAAGDFNRDNHPDLAVLNFASASASVFLSSNGPTADFFLSGAPPSATIEPGGKATYALSISPVAGFNQTVSLSCSGAPSQSMCSVSPSSVSLNGSTPATATLTVTTTAAKSAISNPSEFHLPPASQWPFALLLSLISAWALVRSHPALSRRIRIGCSSALLVLFLILTPSCGGGTGGGGGGVGGAGTPLGTYSIIVSGTSGGVQQSANFTLMVR